MDPATAERLVGAEGAAALAAAAEWADPGSLAAATALRANFAPDLAAAALGQAALRSKAVAKFGPRAAGLFLTSAGLEQASRPIVSTWRAEQFVQRGVRRVVDFGCGIGADAIAFAEAGLEVIAVERDPTTATLAKANLAPYGVEVQCADAIDVANTLLGGPVAAFCDPARRTGQGRTWQVDAFQPSYEFATSLLTDRVGCLKFGPGLPYGLIPDNVDTTWVSADGDLVEASLWSGGAGGRRAVLLPGGAEIEAQATPAQVGAVGTHLIEPNPAVIRAGAVDLLAAQLGARRLDPQIAYLTADEGVATSFGVSFAVLERFAWREKALRSWVRQHQIGTLEIKKRGIELDPATLRRRLKLAGPNSATVVLTPTPEGAQVLVVRRLASG